MARNESWIRVKVRNKKTGESMILYHPPTGESAGRSVDQRLRSLLEMPRPATLQTGPDDCVAIEALHSPADWLTAKVPASEIPTDLR